MTDSHWEKITGGKLAGFGFGLAGFLTLLFVSEPGFIIGLDHANLVFHEAGHPLVGVFSSRLEPYGGTIGQLLIPLLVAVSFWRAGQARAFASAAIWFFENWLNIGRYMADARALELPLVGGGDHDWNTIFSRWHVLHRDTAIAQGVGWLGWTGMAATAAWIVWRWWRDRSRPDDLPLRR